MISDELKKRLGKVFSFTGKVTGLSTIALVTLATVDSVIAQAGVQGLTPALLAFMSGLFGDVVAGRLVDKLLSGDVQEVSIEDFTDLLNEKIAQDEAFRQDIHTLMTKQDAFIGSLWVALQYQENQIVERVLRGIAGYQDFNPSKIIQRFSEEFHSSLDNLNDEVRYLTDLIANLENRANVWEKYIHLSVQADREPSRPSRTSEKLKLARIFSLLEDNPQEDVISPRHREKIRLASIEDVLENHPRFILLGEPGAGKTTTIQHLALQMALKRLNQPDAHPLPMFLYLPEWDDGQSIVSFIKKEWRLVSDPLGLLNRGEMHVFLDGLNELGKNRGDKAKELRDWLEQERGPAHVIVTCRDNDYDDLDLGLPIVLVEGMDEVLIQEFVYSYLEEEAENLLNLILPSDDDAQNDRHIFHLASNPFFLTAFIVVYNTDKKLPRNTGALFQRLILILWKREYERKTAGWIPLQDAVPPFATLAYTMIDDDLPTELPLRYVRKFVRSDGLLKAAASANFIQLRDNRVRFHHQLIQESFAALELQNRNLREVLERPRFSKYTGARVATKWDEVVVALSGITPSADKMIETLTTNDPWLGAECIAGGAKVSPEIYQKFLRSLVKKLDESNTAVKNATIQAIARLKDPQTAPDLAKKLSDNSPRVRRNALTALTEILPRDLAATYVEKAQDDSEQSIQIYAREWLENQGLGELVKEDEDLFIQEFIRPDLKKEAKSNNLSQRNTPISEMSIDMIHSLLKSGDAKERLNIISKLRYLRNKVFISIFKSTIQDTNPQIRHQALLALAELKDDESILLFRSMLQDLNPEIRRQVLHTMVKFKDDESIPLFRFMLQNSKVRNLVFHTLVQFKDDSNILLIKPMLQDSSAKVRYSALKALIKFKNDISIPLIRPMLQDSMILIRQQAILSLTQFKDTESIPSFRFMLHDENSMIRQYAIIALTEFKDIGSVPSFKFMLKDINENVRRQAIIALIEFKDRESMSVFKAALNIRGLGHRVKEKIILFFGEMADKSVLEDLYPFLDDLYLHEITQNVIKKILSRE